MNGERVVIVTGASGGLGGEIAKQFGAAGARIVVNYHRSREDAQDVVRNICEGGGQAFACKADVRRYQEVKSMVDDTVDRWGRIDILVNNAGGYPRGLGFAGFDGKKEEGSLLMEMEEEEWDWLLDSNLKGAFLCIKAVAPQMIKQGGGHIINISSGHAIYGAAGRGHYSAAKAGMNALTKVAARELGKFDIQVNTVMPGLMLTPGIMSVMRPSTVAGQRQSVLKRGPTQTPEEVARFILFLTTMQKVSGQLFNLDNTILF